MDTTLADQAFDLRRRLEIWANDYYFLPDPKDRATELPPSLKDSFFFFISRLSLSLMEDEDNFFGYFFFQMGKELDLTLRAPTGVTFRGTKYILFFQPFLFLEQTPEQMLSSIRHEILHIVFRHLLRARDLRSSYSKLALNLAMDAIVNTYLDPVPADGVTIERINGQYQLYLTPYDTLENYAEQIQRGIDWKKKSNTTTTDQVTDSDKPQFDPAHAHDLWETTEAADPQTMVKFTEKYLDEADKGNLPSHLSSAIAAIKSENPALPWDWYLRRMAGTLSCGTKHTTARLSRRQPYRLDLRGELHHYKARILVALDVSGSISDGEFRQAMEEVLHIVQTQRVEITVIECDDQIKKVYHVRSVLDLQERYPYRGGTAFSPVFAYANKHKIDLLIYFTDGQGEERLEVKPGGYKVFWILSGKGKTLSLHNPPGLIKPLKTKEDITLSELDDPHNDGYSMNNQEPIAFT